MNKKQYITQTQRWLKEMVIGLNFCPFAQKPFEEDRIRYRVSEAKTEEDLLADLVQELENLLKADARLVETTLLIHPNVLYQFDDYIDFLSHLDFVFEEAEILDTFQLASFHPAYYFEGEDPKDVSNFTNRSPYPMLHILRSQSVEKAVAHHPNTALIPEANIQKLKELGIDQVRKLWVSSFSKE